MPHQHADPLSVSETAAAGPATPRHAMLWRLMALLALLPPVFLMPAVPIDETRYLSVAWNMHVRGQWLVPFLNGTPYSDKPPLLFWLINGMWSLTGFHAWSARLLELLFTLCGFALVRALAWRLSGRRDMASQSGWLWLGCAAVAAFSNAIMFDALLTLCSLGVWFAAIDLAERRMLRGIVLGGVGIGLGILTKGPVILLVGTMPMLLAPWWQPLVRQHLWSHYAAMLAAIAIGAAIGLAWALTAAHAGGPAYENALLFRQTLGRVDHSFAHSRPPWWYLPILPALALPWTFSLWRARRPTEAASGHSILPRFALAAFVPPFVAFCVISGKQPHYLLPLLPALAVLGGFALARRNLRVHGAAAGVVIVIVGVAVAIVGQQLAVDGIPPGVWVCSAIVMVMGLTMIVLRRHTGRVQVVALAMLVSMLAAKVAAMDSGGIRYDTRPVGRLLAQAQHRHIPLFSIGDNHSAFDFAGRLRHPIPQGDLQQAQRWARSHPHGWIFSYARHAPFAAAPFYRQPYLQYQLGIWRVVQLPIGNAPIPAQRPAN